MIKTRVVVVALCATAALASFLRLVTVNSESLHIEVDQATSPGGNAAEPGRHGVVFPSANHLGSVREASRKQASATQSTVQLSHAEHGWADLFNH
ncbi:hypothetical protein [Burkholderia sp. BCC1999]|uniref:hypothetical protein n=1 Tax=Burkholderia sp. BCC1999 TaxID=2817448 RepID=UPI002AC32C75|nr:hypothetical protein [Burkholderia sp. BCC1999]